MRVVDIARTIRTVPPSVVRLEEELRGLPDGEVWTRRALVAAGKGREYLFGKWGRHPRLERFRWWRGNGYELVWGNERTIEELGRDGGEKVIRMVNHLARRKNREDGVDVVDPWKE